MIDTAILNFVEHKKIFAIVRTESAETALRATEAAVFGGIKLIEVSMSTPGAVRVISDLRRKYGDRIAVGAGSVISVDLADRAIKSGAQFISSPHTNAGLIKFSISKNVLPIAGAATPTEILSAWDFGVPIIRIFPIATFGGPTYIHSLKDSMPDVRMMAVSGVTINNIREFFNAGSFAIGIGSGLFKPGFIANENYAGIAEQARTLIKAINSPGT
jgi:2-dehydro-3-deoxyphosphogluconate aldolase / (4S)-4-hydroxy-2-oxoglutarate aldolase